MDRSLDEILAEQRPVRAFPYFFNLCLSLQLVWRSCHTEPARNEQNRNGGRARGGRGRGDQQRRREPRDDYPRDGVRKVRQHFCISTLSTNRANECIASSRCTTSSPSSEHAPAQLAIPTHLLFRYSTTFPALSIPQRNHSLRRTATGRW